MQEKKWENAPAIEIIYFAGVQEAGIAPPRRGKAAAFRLHWRAGVC